ncbi:hypothetical protein ACWCP6_07080 [Streptomyces sp. NPDC002004]
MAVVTLAVEAGLGHALTVLLDPPDVAFSETVVTLPVLIALAVVAALVFTAVYVMPSVLLAHWAGRVVLGRTPWWTVPVATTVWLVPALGPPMLPALLAGPGREPDPDDWFTPATLPEWAVVLLVVMTPAALLAHVAVTRSRAGRPVRLCTRILGWGTLVIAGVLVGGLLRALV